MTFLKYFKFPRARSQDPITSFEAVDSVQESLKEHIQIILDCLSKHGPLGKDGIANRTILDSNQVARRLSEMKAMNLIKLTGKKVKSNAGCNEREWTI